MHVLKGIVGNSQGGLPLKSDGVRMLRVPKFFKSYTPGCTNSQKIILPGVLSYKKLYCWVCYFYTQGFTFKNY